MFAEKTLRDLGLAPSGDTVQGVVDVALVRKRKEKMSHMKLMDSMCLKPDTLTECRQAWTALSVTESSLVSHQYAEAVP